MQASTLVLHQSSAGKRYVRFLLTGSCWWSKEFSRSFLLKWLAMLNKMRIGRCSWFPFTCTIVAFLEVHKVKRLEMKMLVAKPSSLMKRFYKLRSVEWKTMHT
ncbi:hypothetical protein Nepgr_033285 [Nepenthes gracilis]|uniref:Uncharacterized protein n=1 Tax=Nepenthes gracilis TaxID=150966 RepID=A0AAD3TMD7_NEPGR|nr:hypothetical protein Nepgr_033285 [Nepenthes gracilis]